MKADTYPLKTIFGKDIRYEVPLYQRPYVWRQETHWEPLWEDIQTVVQQLIPDGEASRDRQVGPHFLGAVVLDQQRTQAGSVERRYVIDGQQRLTTLQLLISAAASVAEKRSLDRSARLLRKLMENDPDLVLVRDDMFKVWPTNIDRDAFRHAMSMTEINAPDDPLNLIQEAHTYFTQAISEWIAAPEQSASEDEMFEALTAAMRDQVQIVVIDLEERDNAQVIFETLNARGTPLLAIDLVKNVMFLRIEESGHDLADLYKSNWRQFEKAYWREEIRQGRLSRARAEIFLMHWLTLKSREETAAHHLFSSFKSLLKGIAVSRTADLLREFSSDGRIFAGFDDQAMGTPEHRFFLNLRALDTTTVFPLLLFLFRQPDETLNTQERRLALAALESWLVRRMLCGLTTKNYNRFVLELLQAVDADPTDAPEILITKLRESTSDTNLWPTDDQVRDALVSMPLYKRLSNARVRMVLSAVENALRTDKSEEIVIPSGLTIEHVLPQAWRENWPTAPPEDPVLELDRQVHVHRIGNLTLVTQKLNSPLSNLPWREKRIEINKHSVLQMNRRIIDDHPDAWDEGVIDRRSAELASIITSVWPGPTADWSTSGQASLLKPVPAPREPDKPPSPEALLEWFIEEPARRLLEAFLDQVSSWDGVRVRVGEAAADENRRIFLHRRGSPYGAFCRINTRLKRVRLRLTPEDAPSDDLVTALEVKDPYRLYVTVSSSEALGQALRLAHTAYDQAEQENLDD